MTLSKNLNTVSRPSAPLLTIFSKMPKHVSTRLKTLAWSVFCEARMSARWRSVGLAKNSVTIAGWRSAKQRERVKCVHQTGLNGRGGVFFADGIKKRK